MAGGLAELTAPQMRIGQPWSPIKIAQTTCCHIPTAVSVRVTETFKSEAPCAGSSF
jgi:hypothetical protein